MNSKEINKMKSLFATRNGSPLYKIFYKGRYYNQKENGEVLLSKQQILEKLGIDFKKYSYSDRNMITTFFNRAIGVLRHQAWDRMQPWGTVKVMHKTGDTVWLHGYSLDPAKQEAMGDFKHKQSVYHYIAEKKQQKAFAVARGKDKDPQFKLPTQEEIVSFKM